MFVSKSFTELQNIDNQVVNKSLSNKHSSSIEDNLEQETYNNLLNETKNISSDVTDTDDDLISDYNHTLSKSNKLYYAFVSNTKEKTKHKHGTPIILYPVNADLPFDLKNNFLLSDIASVKKANSMFNLTNSFTNPNYKPTILLNN